MTGVGKQLALLGVALIIGAALLQFGYDSPSISAGNESIAATVIASVKNVTTKPEVMRSS